MVFFKKILTVLVLFIGAQTLSAQIGNTAPNFTVVDTHGDTIRLYDILDEGKYVILDFFYTTCGPCIFYSPQVNLAYEKYGCNTQDVVFIAIDYQDTNAEVIAYDAQYGIQYPSVSGTQGGGNSVVSQYGVTGFPTFYLIDSTHKIIDQIDPPTLIVFDFRFEMHGIQPMACLSGTDAQHLTPNSIKIYPNPVQYGEVVLELEGVADNQGTVMVFDVAGHLIQEKTVDQPSDQSIQLEISDWPAGLYLSEFISENGMRWYGRFVKN